MKYNTAALLVWVPIILVMLVILHWVLLPVMKPVGFAPFFASVLLVGFTAGTIAEKLIHSLLERYPCSPSSNPDGSGTR